MIFETNYLRIYQTNSYDFFNFLGTLTLGQQCQVPMRTGSDMQSYTENCLAFLHFNQANHLHLPLSSRVLKDLTYLLYSYIIAIPRKVVLTAFVGRLHIDTTEEDLTKYLVDEGMKGVVCKKLQPKDGHKFKQQHFVCRATQKAKTFFTTKAAGLKELNYVTGSFIGRHG